MAKRASFIPIGVFSIDPASPHAVYRQLYERLRQAILNGQLKPGARLPSSRTLANELKLARATVLSAYDLLLAEGYIEGQTGSGTYVAHVLPDSLLSVTGEAGGGTRTGADQPLVSRRGRMMTTVRRNSIVDDAAPVAFAPLTAALDDFPHALWAQVATRTIRKLDPAMLRRGDPIGYLPLREATAEYLQTARGVHCSPDQIVICSGAQQAMDLAARVLLDPGDAVWLENPGYFGARAIFIAADAQLVPVPVDAEGIDLAAGIARCPTARMAYVTPSHQYPLGITMSLARRLALLEWAHQHQAWVMEDDYDSEYRYSSPPVVALQGLDRMGRVIYVGTFSKALFPGLRLGYLVVPTPLVDVFRQARATVDFHPPMMVQAILADFIAEGHFTRHIHRMRRLYAERQAVLVRAAERKLAGLLELVPSDSGMYLIGWLRDGIPDVVAAEYARRHDVVVTPLSSLSLEPGTRSGLMLRYAALSEGAIIAGVDRLARALRALYRDLAATSVEQAPVLRA
jgi:GntR family transcriptional regulator / MocR family aminotransferase